MTDNAESILKEIEAKGEKSFLPVIGPKKGKILDDAVRQSRAKRILEVGTFIGYSAIRMARLLGDDGAIITIEKERRNAEQAERNIRRAGYAKMIEVIVGDAKQVIPKLQGKFDLIFLDAEKDEYLAYLRLAEEKMHSGSVTVADNAGVFAQEMRDYLDYVRSSGRYKSCYYESTLEFNDNITDGVEVSIRL